MSIATKRTRKSRTSKSITQPIITAFGEDQSFSEPPKETVTMPAVYWRMAKSDEPRLDRLLSTDAHAMAYRRFADNHDEHALRPPQDQHEVGSARLAFLNSSRSYIAVACGLKIKGWRPRHMLDIPATPKKAKLPWAGCLDGGDFAADPKEFVTRDAALAQAARKNLVICSGGDGNPFVRSDLWWVVVQFSTMLDTSMISLDLCGMVGKATISLDHGVRVVTPTTNEISRYGKGGAL